MPKKPPPSSGLPETIVTDAKGLQECLQHLERCSHVAFDTEFVGEQTYRPDLCLVQVATSDRLFIIDPLSCGPLTEFWELLADPARVAIVHAGREEMRMCHFGIGRTPAHVFDVQIAAGLVGYSYPIGYSGLVQELLGVRLSKGETLTDWRRRPLTAAQEKYAFDDVRYLIPIWKKLHDRLRRLNREDWAAEEFAAFVRRSIGDDPTVERWRKIKGTGGLDPRGLAVARELYRWRDARAALGNRPPRSILRDELLGDLARRPPNKLEDILSFRGLAKSDAPHILEAIRRAKALPPSELPEPEERENDAPHVTLLANLLGVVLAEWCARNRIAQSLVATASDLKRLVRARQPGASPADASSLANGWRQRAILPELEAFLDGKRSLVVENPSSPHPLRLAALPIEDL